MIVVVFKRKPFSVSETPVTIKVSVKEASDVVTRRNGKTEQEMSICTCKNFRP
jgi:hypothetical protein